MAPPKNDERQHERFIETARALECDEDKERFEAKLKSPGDAEVEG
jgi:hypothetical protein